MFTLFIQKKKGDVNPFPLTKQINDFLKKTKANGVIIAPGHLSHNTPEVKALIDNILDGTNVKSFGLLNCYGKNTISTYETYLSGKSKLLKIKRNNKSDHRKMVFVFKFREIDILEVDSKNYEKFLSEIEVIGVAIGSSNFSYTTYGGSLISIIKKGKSILKKSGKANKGEADILMFEDDDFKGEIVQQIGNDPNGNLVLSQSFTPVPDEFFKDILRNTFNYSL